MPETAGENPDIQHESDRGIVKYPLLMQLTIPLSKTGEPLFRQVYISLRETILSGSLRGGEKLPSTRDLAEQLGISRTVVLAAYDLLLAEGFAEGRGGSGTYVTIGVGSARTVSAGRSVPLRVSRFGRTAAAEWSMMNFALQMPRSGLSYDFAYGRSDLESFPFAMWRRILLRCARTVRVAELDYGQAAGSMALRDAICVHVRRSRAVVCDASQIVIVNGSQQALDLIARVLMEPGDHVAFEDPSYQGTWEVLRAAGVDLLPIELDRDGLDPERIPEEARMVFVTPSHQFPTGVILPLARRLALLKWAKRRNAIVVEDDYDGEFRYEGQPLESLQGLDREGRVIYIGTFSRTVFSALRIGYLIAPKRLVQAFTAAKWLCDRHTATLEQATLAEFISSGMYERYLRRVRRRNSSRREALMGAIRTYLGNHVEVTGDGSGAHVVLWPKRRISEESIISKAAAHGVRVYGISAYCLAKPRRTGIMLGYSRMGEAQIREGVRRLGEVF
jgi:GntR family transcriptional regulator/MocR family aminotransferase